MKSNIAKKSNVRYILENINFDISEINRLRLYKNEVQMWVINCMQNRHWIEQKCNLLSEDEIKQIDKLMVYEDRMRSMCGKVLTKMLLAKYIGINPEDVSLRKEKQGKPYLNNKIKEDIQFNVSHSGEYVLLAFTKEQKIGVDIEKIQKFEDYKNVAKQFFCASESEDVIRANSINCFFKYWTQKEAFVKATGEGLWRDLSSFEVKNKKVYSIKNTMKKLLLKEWNIHSFKIGNCYMAATALKRKIGDVYE